VTTLDYAPAPPTSRLIRRLVFWAAGTLPGIALPCLILDNFFAAVPYGVTTRYTAYHYIAAAIVLYHITWTVVITRTTRRRYRLLACLIAVVWLCENTYHVYKFIRLIRADIQTWR
jgi:hypothetical protein